MDQRLIDAAAQAGDIDALYGLLHNDPYLLENIDKVPFLQTPLHVAILAKQTHFGKEIVSLKPSFASKLDQDGFSPMHLASATGQVEMVNEFLTLISPKLCILKGREKITPLHCAAMAGSIDVISLLLDSYPLCLLDRTLQKETAFHLAVKNNQLSSFKILLEWLGSLYELEVDSYALQLARKAHSLNGIKGLLEGTKLLDKKEFRATINSFAFGNSEVEDYELIKDSLKQIKKEELLNWKDDEGNTVLHLAASRKQTQEKPRGHTIIEALLSDTTPESGIKKVDLNATDANNLTALDIILHLPREKEVNQIEDILHKAGAATASQIITLSPSSLTNIPNCRGLQLKDHPLLRDLHNVLLVFALLVATTCFLIGMNPPGGIWQDNYKHNFNSSTTINTTVASDKAGTGFLGKRPYSFYPLMFLHAAGFLLSLTTIARLEKGSPHKKLLLIFVAVMFGAYIFSTISIMPDEYLPLFENIFWAMLMGIINFQLAESVE